MAKRADRRAARRTRPGVVTLPADVFEELCEEAEFHASHRSPGVLGPYRAVAAAAARAVARHSG